MDLQEISKKSSETDTAADAKWLQIDDEFGYLGIPTDKKEDIIAREILCSLQGVPHIPIIENVGTMDNHIWYKVEYLESFYEYYKTHNPWDLMWRLHTIKHIETGYGDIDNQIDTVEKTLKLIQEKAENYTYSGINFMWDIHDKNIRVRKDGTLILTDVLFY